MTASDTFSDAELLGARVRADFPFFERSIAGKRCVYLDSASTSLTPQVVISKLEQFYSEVSANVDRAAYVTAEVATQLFEDARAKVADAVGCDTGEVVFTRGCTEAINEVAAGLQLPVGKSVALSLFEHHANLLPWMARYRLVWFDPLCDDLDRLDDLLRTEDVGLLAVTACSNVSGAVLPVRDYVAVARSHGIPVVADAAQLAPHFWSDLRQLDADFIAFSSHKMLGPFGIGALCARREWLERMEPTSFGGGAVEEVTPTSFRLRPFPQRLEPGTPPIVEAVAFGEALDYFRAVGPDRIERSEALLLHRLLAGLRAIPFVRIVDDEWTGRRAPVASIYIEDDLVSADQLSRILSDRFGVCTRAGHHCAHPYMTTRGLNGAVRLAASFYNTPDEIDFACAAIGEVVGSLL